MALGSTQPLTEMSTRSISWDKVCRCVRLTTYHHPVPLSRNLGTLTCWNPLSPCGPVTGLFYLYLICLTNPENLLYFRLLKFKYPKDSSLL